jgi:malate dehydrogenase (oxaloacetate-decarboxylating)(NADP+)
MSSIGRPHVIETRRKRYALKIRPGTDFDLVNPEDDPRYRDYVDLLVRLAGRRGVTQEAARTMVRTNTTVIAALAVRLGIADTMLCGLEGRYMAHLKNIRDVIGLAPGVREFAALSLVITNKGAYFMTDTQVTAEPGAEEIADIAVLAAAHVRRFGLEPKIALLSHSNFGSYDSASSRKMQAARERLAATHPALEVEGEMHGDAALLPALRERIFPNSRLKGEANVLIMPNLDAANIAYQMSKVLADALPVGPILIGAARPAHILTPSSTSRGVINMTAVSVVEAQANG